MRDGLAKAKAVAYQLRLAMSVKPGTAPPLFFCHIPKTAGTSLRRALEENYHPREVMPTQ